MPPAIAATQLTKRFTTKLTAPGLLGSLRAAVRPAYRETVAVHPCTFTVEHGEAVAFIGPNGAGKSTTIKMLTGILYPSGGQARVLGLVPWTQRRLLAYNVAAVFGQKSQLWYHLPPQATFDLLARVYDLEPREYRARAGDLIALFDLGPHLQTPVRRLSLGERMRCEIAAALLHRPKVLFLDEPTIGLDVVAKQRIRALIRRLNAEEGVTVFLTSHDAGDVEQVCRRVIVVNHGRIILDDAVAALKRDFLQSKVIDLKLEDHPGHDAVLPFEGVKVVERTAYGLRLEVDTGRQPVDAVIAYLVGHYRVADITIADPPLEEIIAHIYQRRPPAEPPHPPTPSPMAGGRGGGLAPGRALLPSPPCGRAGWPAGGRVARSRAAGEGMLPLPLGEGQGEGASPLPLREGLGVRGSPLPLGEGQGEGASPLPLGEGQGEGVRPSPLRGSGAGGEEREVPA